MPGACRMRGVPQIIAACDGTQIAIRRPGNSGDNYLNRKKFAAMNTSACCDADGLFTDVYVGWTGRAHDSTVLQSSPLWNAIQQGQIGLAMREASTTVEGTTVRLLASVLGCF